MLASGDLDTVSSQAFETARRVRPLILADIRRSEAELGSYLLSCPRGSGPLRSGSGRRERSRGHRHVGRRDGWNLDDQAASDPDRDGVRDLPDSPGRGDFDVCSAPVAQHASSSADHTARPSPVMLCWSILQAASCGSSSGRTTSGGVRRCPRKSRLAFLRRPYLTALKTSTPPGCSALQSPGRSPSASCRREPM